MAEEDTSYLPLGLHTANHAQEHYLSVSIYLSGQAWKLVLRKGKGKRKTPLLVKRLSKAFGIPNAFFFS